MVLFVNSPQSLFENVSVDLSRRNVRVPQHHLNRPEISAPLEQMGGKGVTQQVWLERNSNVGLSAIAGDDLPESLPSQSLSETIYKQPIRGLSFQECESTKP